MGLIKNRLLKLLHRHLKPLVSRYYVSRYREDMIKMLKLYKIYHRDLPGIDPVTAISIIKTQEGWTTKYSAFIWGICVYCGYLAPAGKEEVTNE